MSKTTTTAPAESPEAPQAGALPADFAAVVASADALEAGAVQAVQPAGQAEADDDKTTADDLLPLLELARVAAADELAWWPKFGETWSDARLRKIAAAGANVLNHYGVELADLLGHPLFGLAAATVPPAFATWAAMRQRRAEIERQQRATTVQPLRPAPPPGVSS